MNVIIDQFTQMLFLAAGGVVALVALYWKWAEDRLHKQAAEQSAWDQILAKAAETFPTPFRDERIELELADLADFQRRLQAQQDREALRAHEQIGQGPPTVWGNSSFVYASTDHAAPEMINLACDYCATWNMIDPQTSGSVHCGACGAPLRESDGIAGR